VLRFARAKQKRATSPESRRVSRILYSVSNQLEYHILPTHLQSPSLVLLRHPRPLSNCQICKAATLNTSIPTSAVDTMTLPLRSSQDLVQSSRPAPFRFLDLPKEIQSKIIEATLAIERQAFWENRLSDDPLNFETPRIYDFNINAFGLRSHTLPPFGLLFVNKEVSGDALAVVYQNSSFAVYAEISRGGVPDLAFGYIPNVVKHISPMVITNAREVTYRISTINEGLRHLDGNSKLWNDPAVLERALSDLQILVSQANFLHIKKLNIVLMTHGLVQKHLNVLFK
jgi:hypothetical protein